MSRRVVVTGVGAITPIGNTVDESWYNLCKGESGIGEITKFDTADFKVKIAAEVKNFDPYKYLEHELVRRTDPHVHYALYATRQAINNSRLFITNRTGVVVGTGAGGISSYDKHHDTLIKRGPSKVSPYFITSFLPNMVAGEIAIMVGATGPNKVVVTACAAGAHAICDSFDLITNNRADTIICGGTEAAITPGCVAAFTATGALSTSGSRPFDKSHDGFVIGEGAGILILEELTHALDRRAPIYAEIIAYAYNADAHHITQPNSKTQVECLRSAIKDAAEPAKPST